MFRLERASGDQLEAHKQIRETMDLMDELKLERDTVCPLPMHLMLIHTNRQQHKCEDKRTTLSPWKAESKSNELQWKHCGLARYAQPEYATTSAHG